MIFRIELFDIECIRAGTRFNTISFLAERNVSNKFVIEEVSALGSNLLTFSVCRLAEKWVLHIPKIIVWLGNARNFMQMQMLVQLVNHSSISFTLSKRLFLF